jgi:hypothetical protein
MNERIQQLAEQAGLYDEKSPDEVPEFTACFEKFAELIIRECAVYVKNSNCFTYASQADLCAERMKEHFGVE